MREVIVAQIGSCGSNMGCSFWNELCQEHAVDLAGQSTPNQPVEKVQSFFNEAGDNKFVPRSIFGDMEMSTQESISSGSMGRLFSPDSYLSGNEGSRGLWSSGFYMEGQQLVEEIMDLVRKQVETCDLLSSFMTFHALSGGTGSGMGVKLLSEMREQYPDRINKTISLFNSKSHPECDLGIYNEVLSVHQLVENCDLVSICDNDAMNMIARRLEKKPYATFEDTNSLISRYATGVTTGLRFSGMLNSDFRNIATNLVPFPRLHFFLPSISPLIPSDSKVYSSLSAYDLTKHLFEPTITLNSCNPIHGRYMCISAMFRGKFSTREVENIFYQHKKHRKTSKYFKEWIPSNVQISYCRVPRKDVPVSVAYISNTTAIQTCFKDSSERFTAMFRKKRYLHYYVQDGMDEMEFTEAESNMNDLVSEFQEWGHEFDDDGEEEAIE